MKIVKIMRDKVRFDGYNEARNSLHYIFAGHRPTIDSVSCGSPHWLDAFKNFHNFVGRTPYDSSRLSQQRTG